MHFRGFTFFMLSCLTTHEQLAARPFWPQHWALRPQHPRGFSCPMHTVLGTKQVQTAKMQALITVYIFCSLLKFRIRTADVSRLHAHLFHLHNFTRSTWRFGLIRLLLPLGSLPRKQCVKMLIWCIQSLLKLLTPSGSTRPAQALIEMQWIFSP